MHWNIDKNKIAYRITDNVNLIIYNNLDLYFFENNSYKKVIQLAKKQREHGHIPDDIFYSNNENSEIWKMYVELVMNPYDCAGWSSGSMEL